MGPWSSLVGGGRGYIEGREGLIGRWKEGGRGGEGGRASLVGGRRGGEGEREGGPHW